LNKITSPAEVYLNANLILPEDNVTTSIVAKTSIKTNQSLLEASILANTNPWDLILTNHKKGTWDAVPGETLYVRGDSDSIYGTQISPYIQEAQISPLPLVQGAIIKIDIVTTDAVSLSGSLAGNELHFFPSGENQYTAYQGIHAQYEPGLTPFYIKGSTDVGPAFSISQMVITRPGGYGFETIFVEPSTLDPDVNRDEDEFLSELVSEATPEKYWELPLKCPLDQPTCIKSWYGTRRSYNDGAYYSFHSGIDYGICANFNVYAPSDGIVKATESFIVRGNTLVIDQGWGIYTVFYHLDEFLVEVGDTVKRGQHVAMMGSTGRSTGTHLHFDLWVNGVQVNPLLWVEDICQ
jgi:murein DD-endopeptidase MepM/ murein hydrolase activator NlpD